MTLKVAVLHPIPPAVIYGQDVLYAVRGQDARSRPAKAGIQWFMQYIPAQALPAAGRGNDNVKDRLLFPLTRVDSGLRRAATGILGGLFQAPLYHLHPCRRALTPHTGLPVHK